MLFQEESSKICLEKVLGRSKSWRIGTEKVLGRPKSWKNDTGKAFFDENLCGFFLKKHFLDRNLDRMLLSGLFVILVSPVLGFLAEKHSPFPDVKLAIFFGIDYFSSDKNLFNLSIHVLL